MITRIEIDGFKSFMDFKLDVPPFLALFGPNASGKSNLFDALRLVANLVRLGPRQGLLDQSRGSASDLFHRYSDGSTTDTASITVGMVVGSAKFGPRKFGPLAIRCRIVLAKDEGLPEVKECRAWVSALEDRSWLDARAASKQVVNRLRDARDAVLSAGETSYIAFESEPLRPGAGVLASALFSECRSWPALMLEPDRMRRPAEAPDNATLSPDGSNLAAVIERLARHDLLWRVETDLTGVIPGAVEIKPLFDERREEYDFDVVFENSGRTLPRLLSDGTLRALGLLAARYDPESQGVLAIEEVENGLHPGRVAELVRRLTRNLPDFQASSLRSLDQILLTSHSPTLAGALWPEQSASMMFVEPVTRMQGGRRSGVSRVLPVAESGEPGTFTSPWDVERFLSVVREART